MVTISASIGYKTNPTSVIDPIWFIPDWAACTAAGVQVIADNGNQFFLPAERLVRWSAQKLASQLISYEAILKEQIVPLLLDYPGLLIEIAKNMPLTDLLGLIKKEEAYSGSEATSQNPLAGAKYYLVTSAGQCLAPHTH